MYRIFFLSHFLAQEQQQKFHSSLKNITNFYLKKKPKKILQGTGELLIINNNKSFRHFSRMNYTQYLAKN